MKRTTLLSISMFMGLALGIVSWTNSQVASLANANAQETLPANDREILLAQIQDPALSGEVNKDTVHVNEDLLPKKRTWELIQDPWIDPNDPTVIKLNPDDDSRENWRRRRDPSLYPDRQPGPMNVHRYDVHFENVGIPTFFRRPLALTPDDLKAGKVDVAIFGAPLGQVMPASGGQFWGPMMVRATPTGNAQYGSAINLKRDTLVETRY